MGFLGKLFGMTTSCPACGAARAKESLFGVKCVSRECIHYDPGYAQQIAGASPARTPAAPPWRDQPPVEFKEPIGIEYVNYAGERKSFTAEARSMRLRRRHLSACVQPTGRRIALSLDRIGNLADLESRLASNEESGPSPREAHVMAYHRRRGTTSPLAESLHERYPDF